MRCFTAAVVALAACVGGGVTRAQTAPDPAKVEALVRSTDAAVAALKAEIEEGEALRGRYDRGVIKHSTRGVSAPRGSGLVRFHSAAVKRAAIAKIDARLAPLKAKLDEYEKGGRIDHGTFGLGLPVRVGEVGRLGPVDVAQVVGPSAMLVRRVVFVLLVEGEPTAGVADKSVVDLKGVFEVVGTKTYETAIGGTNTVFVLRRFDAGPLEAAVRARRAAAAREAADAPPPTRD